MGRTLSPAARVRALTDALRARNPHGGPTIGDLPHGVEVARRLAIVLALGHSTDPGDQQRVRVAALRAGALMPRDGDPTHPAAALLGAIIWEEETGADTDPVFWVLVGGRPVSHWRHLRSGPQWPGLAGVSGVVRS